ncbi:hypothetical protein [Thioalkalivibrio sp. ALMg9]|uniref:hypothetical protein n=1 Tax=Thioalkalivibrio sp. ALMg9 TaxID=1266912 RepID=UPI000477EFDF|nr:hypothetical protein [Thioalkalivibrio sp. ALMg9]
MEHSEAKLASIAAPKQGVETGKTGFHERAAARKLLDISEEWLASESKTNPVRLLRCLCEMTAESEGSEEPWCTNKALAQCAVRGGASASTWGVGSDGGIDDRESARKAVTNAWREVEDLWSRKSQGVEERFRDAGWPSCPRPEKQKSQGGRNKPTKYFIKLDPISESEGPSDSLPDTVSPYGVRYYTEDLQLGRGARAALVRGWPITGWRAVLTGFLIFLVVSLGAVGAWVSLVSIAQASTTGHVVAVAMVVALAAGLAWWVVGPLEKLSRNRIALAPFWMQRATSGWDDRVLELRPDFAHGVNRLYLAHYSADCPICSAPVHVAAGGREFYGRLVGRCAASPAEHVFSFDHVTRTGLPLRRHIQL